jgi:hypothetical protein
MWSKNREPLTPAERKRLWQSFLWALASLAVWPLTLGWIYVGPRLAKSLGVEEHVAILYHEELIAIPSVLAFGACFAMSYLRAEPAIKKRPRCLIWIWGPVVLLPVAWLVTLVILVFTLSK